MPKRHLHRASLHWDAGTGPGTDSFKSYSREHRITSESKPEIVATSAFHGKTHYNPEDLLLAALASCHMLWYLHLCSQNGIVVVKYEDAAECTMIEDAATGGKIEHAVAFEELRSPLAEIERFRRGSRTDVSGRIARIARQLNRGERLAACR